MCWIWQGCCNKDGYGRCKASSHLGEVQAHRYFYKKHKGKIPRKYEVDHLCETTTCVNPEHLDAVTNKEHQKRTHERDPNIAIRLSKILKASKRVKELGRQRRMLTILQVRCIRSLHNLGVRQIDLAKNYAISVTAIKKIYLRKTYKDT